MVLIAKRVLFWHSFEQQHNFLIWGMQQPTKYNKEQQGAAWCTNCLIHKCSWGTSKGPLSPTEQSLETLAWRTRWKLLSMTHKVLHNLAPRFPTSCCATSPILTSSIHTCEYIHTSVSSSVKWGWWNSHDCFDN